jgi:hypothetical protein
MTQHWTPEKLAAIADRVERGATLTYEEKQVTSGALRMLAADLWKASLSQPTN